MQDKLKFLGFYNKGQHCTEGRQLVGVIFEDGNYTSMADDCYDTEKPTYYYKTDGTSVDYLEHAQFIASNSFSSYDNGVSYWVYPMLTFQDKGDYFAVFLKITHFERKPVKAPLEAKLD